MLIDDSLHGRAVLSEDGIKIGEVTHLVVDAGTFRIAALEVRVHKDVADRVGLAHGLLRRPTIQIPSDQIRSIGDAIILAMSVDGLRDIVPTPGTTDRPGAPAQTR